MDSTPTFAAYQGFASRCTIKETGRCDLGTGTLIQIVFDIFMACGLFVVVMRMNRAPKDDPRLSRGLQLLQSKISVLEDLSDRTEAQVTQLTAILESKAREVQAKVELAERHVHEIRVSMDRSLEVAQIFQDKIPHKEIIERQNTIKYVHAARLAHGGSSVDEIASAVDLPRGELEFIASVNRDRLMFTETELPEWARGEIAAASAAGTTNASFSDRKSAAGAMSAAGAFIENAQSQVTAPIETSEEQAKRLRAEIELSENQRLVENLSRLQSEMQNLDMQLAREGSHRDISSAYDVPKVETDHLKKLGEEFRKAVREGNEADARQPFGQAFGQGLGHIDGQISGLKSTISGILEPGAFDLPSVAAHNNANANANSRANAQNTNANSNSFFGGGVTNSAQSPAAPTRTVVTAAPVTETKDPVLARAVAQAKVQAALRSGMKPAQSAPQSTRVSNNTDLSAARKVARDMNGNVVAPAKPGEVRRVMFPRIDGSDV